MPAHHILLLVACNVVWGFNFIAGKIGTAVFEPLLFSALRFAFVLVLLAPFIRWVPGQMKRILLLGLVLGGGHYTLMFYAIQMGHVLSTIAVASQLVVPMSTLLAVWLLGERIQWVRTLAIAMCFLGVAIIGFEPVGSNDIPALMLTLVATLAMAFATIIMRNIKSVGVFNLQAWIALVAAPLLIGLSIAIEGPPWETLPLIPIEQYWTPFYSGVGATIFGHGMMYWLLTKHAVNLVTPFITLSTVFAVGFSIWIYGDALTPRIMAGGLMTLVGVFIISRRQKTPATMNTANTTNKS